MPFLAWDLINEPSFGQYLWSARPNGDPSSFAQWNAWLRKKYPSHAALAAAWNLPRIPEDAVIPVPEASIYTGPGISRTSNLHDFYLFSQDKFTDWVAQIRAAIRATGSQQLITVGQDEGGNTQRLIPSFFSSQVDFTANHAWYQDDHLLWNAMAAKRQGKPMLIQEMGVAAGTGPDGVARKEP